MIARLQQTLLRKILSMALENYICFDAFTHYIYDTGAGSSLVSHSHSFWFGMTIFILLLFLDLNLLYKLLCISSH